MKLIVKLPRGKLPFIGIIVPELDFGQLNQDLVLQFKHADYKIVFEFRRNKLSMRLISEENLIVRFYNDLVFDEDKQRSWFYRTKNARAFNFSHVEIKDDKEMVVRTKEKLQLFILKVSSYEIEAIDASK